jgi:hypothetical protein
MNVRLDETGHGDPATRIQNESGFLRCVVWDSNEAPAGDGEITRGIGAPHRDVFDQDIEIHRRPFVRGGCRFMICSHPGSCKRSAAGGAALLPVEFASPSLLYWHRTCLPIARKAAALPFDGIKQWDQP